MDTLALTMNTNSYHSQQDMEVLPYNSFMKLYLSTKGIKNQSNAYHFRKIDQRKTKVDIRSERKQRYKNTLNEPCNDMSESQMRLNNMTQGKEFSTSINNNGFDLNK